jgi:LysM repeat protein
MSDESNNEVIPQEIVLPLEAGDTYEMIAEAFETSVEKIKELNPEVDLSQETPGENLRVPFIPRCEGGTLYVVKQGDTLYGLAQQFGVTVAAIRQSNPFLEFIGLRAGLTICIPGTPIPEPQPGTCPDGFFYMVAAGDTLFSIAARNNTTVNAILQANPGLDPNRLIIGQRICIPVPPPVTCPGGFFYTVVAGDTLFSIATRYNTTVNAILQANPGLNPNRLFIGQRICIPVPPPVTCPGGFFYTVVAGDTLFSIATRYNTTVNAVLQANPGLDPNRLFIGQRICIPA